MDKYKSASNNRYLGLKEHNEVFIIWRRNWLLQPNRAIWTETMQKPESLFRISLQNNDSLDLKWETGGGG